MINTLYLHIGIYKTGTSALQHFCIENQNILLNQFGICYPEFGRNPKGIGAHHYFSMPVSPSRPDGYRGRSFSENCLCIQEEAICKEAKHLLISSEAFCKVSDLSLLAPILKLAQRIKVIVYLRRQDEFLEAAYS